MTPKRRKEINLLAETIREGLELDTPIDIEAAVVRLGGKFREEAIPEEKPEARIEKAGERFQIILRANYLETRKRFSIAHELGHLFLHMGYLLNPDTWLKGEDYKDSVYYRFGYGTEEAEANEFAAALLMPEKEFRQIADRNTKDGRCSIQTVADYFHTSKEAALNRGRLLGLFRTE